MKNNFVTRVTKKLDLFPEPVITININGNSTISSKTGVFFTLVLFVALFSYAGIRLQTMILHS